MNGINGINESSDQNWKNNETNADDDRDLLYFDFADHFNGSKVSEEKIQFVKNYLENKMGFDLNEDHLIEFSAIRSSIFGFLVAHIVTEYEKFIRKA